MLMFGQVGGDDGSFAAAPRQDSPRRQSTKTQYYQLSGSDVLMRISSSTAGGGIGGTNDYFCPLPAGASQKFQPCDQDGCSFSCPDDPIIHTSKATPTFAPPEEQLSSNTDKK